MTMGNGKTKNAIEYLDNLVEKGKATRGSITPLKIAFTKVVQTVDGDTWEDTEVKTIDVDDYMARFTNLTMGKYSSDSLTAYKSRVNKVVKWYLQFLNKPGWTPDMQSRNRTTKVAVKPIDIQKLKSTEASQAAAPSIDVAQSMPAVAGSAHRILYPYPLTNGQLVHISLPLKLSKKDARRIGAFIESIAIDEIEDKEA